MPCRYGSTAVERIRTEIIEADFEIGFNLNDLCESRPAEAARIVRDAEGVYVDVVARVRILQGAEGALSRR